MPSEQVNERFWGVQVLRVRDADCIVRLQGGNVADSFLERGDVAAEAEDGKFARFTPPPSCSQQFLYW